MGEMIDPNALFERVKALWPRSIALRGDPQAALNAVYWPLEQRLGPADDWLSLGAWAFHQSLWSLAAAERNDALLVIDDVPFCVFDRNMRKNLADDSWSSERASYGSAGG